MAPLSLTVQTYRCHIARFPTEVARNGRRRRPCRGTAYDSGMTAPTIPRPGLDAVDALAPFSAAYRRFYEQPGDVALANAFLHSRLERAESVVFIAEAEGAA